MPSYTYECACGQIWEVQHSIHDEPDFECDNCGGTMERKLFAPRIKFVGGGYYTNDKHG